MRYCLIDTETTGLDPKSNTLVEIGAIRDDGKTMESLINPGIPIPPTASAVHHITDEDVVNSPSRDQVVARLLDFIGDRTPVAFNAKFDSGFLPEINRPWLCLHRLAKHLYPDAPGYGNQVLRYWLKINVKPSGNPHRALADVEVSLSLMHKMLEKCQKMGMTSMNEIANFASVGKSIGSHSNQSQDVSEFIMPFGKHKGEPLKSIPQDYLKWLVDKSNIKADLRELISAHLSQVKQCQQPSSNPKKPKP